MLGGIWNFVKRHRRKFVFAGVLVGGGILLKNYAIKKIKEWEEQQMTECIERMRKEQHFESTQRTCNSTVFSFVRNMRDEIGKLLDTDSLTTLLKSKPENKLKIWEDLKVVSFSRAITAVYSCSLLVLLLRVKLSILGGYMYIDTVKKVNGTNNHSLSVPFDLQQKYLSNVQHLLGPGLQKLVSAVEKAVREVIGSVPLNQYCSIKDLETWIGQIRNRIENGEENGTPLFGNIEQLLMPQEDPDCSIAGPSNSHCNYNGKFHDIMNETRDIFDSKDCQVVLSHLLNNGFSVLVDYISEFYRGPSDNGFNNVNTIQVAMAKLVPVASGILFTIYSNDQSEFLLQMLTNEKLKNWSANVYEAFVDDSK